MAQPFDKLVALLEPRAGPGAFRQFVTFSDVCDLDPGHEA
jgi:hypothetical protein